MDDDARRVARALGDYFDEVVQWVRLNKGRSGPSIVDRLTEHLGVDPAGLPVVAHRAPAHQLVNLDLAVEALVDAQGGGETVGVGGGDQLRHMSLGDIIQHCVQWQPFPVATVQRVALPTGPSTVRQAVAHGIHLFRYEGVPVAALQTGGQPECGRGDVALEIVAPEGIAEHIITDVRRLVVERSVFRGQVLTLGSGEDAYNPTIGGCHLSPLDGAV
jgi:hypothetical protein